MVKKSYTVRRFYWDEDHPHHRRVILRGVTRAIAERHCQRKDSSAHDKDDNLIWFDGFEEETPNDYTD